MVVTQKTAMDQSGSPAPSCFLNPLLLPPHFLGVWRWDTRIQNPHGDVTIKCLVFSLKILRPTSIYIIYIPSCWRKLYNPMISHPNSKPPQFSPGSPAATGSSSGPAAGHCSSRQPLSSARQTHAGSVQRCTAAAQRAQKGPWRHTAKSGLATTSLGQLRKINGKCHIVGILSMDWFKGKFTGKPHI
jgi:hypothetical protein